MTNLVKVLLFGRKVVTAETLKWLVENPCVEVLGVVTDSHLEGSPTARAAVQLGIKVLEHEAVKEQLASGVLVPDLGISVLYWRKFSGSMLLPEASRGMINFHPAPLPAYKGCGGYNFAILDSLEEWASTAHYCDSSIDTGPIIDVCNFPICHQTATAQSLERMTLLAMKSQITEVLHRAIMSPCMLPTTPNLGGRYISRQEMEASKEVRAGDDVERKSRAFFFPPYEGAWTMVNGMRCTLVTPSILGQLTQTGTTHIFTARP
jgi:methionyl-tRNA formyltransferase